ncbi:hypothetical protein [Hymenobacter sp. YC55]|uniref:hypothetical protein n=1 Tax=Hymenobacter sp. YC55 TaxID=3034019 RepID=UPI0023F85534|nr:hypothetical protein [Hymenobacter sp. YC55]MDF7811963.1 hypothetical protein [Hymenobacter sp. YC55]
MATDNSQLLTQPTPRCLLRTGRLSPPSASHDGKPQPAAEDAHVCEHLLPLAMFLGSLDQPIVSNDLPRIMPICTV